MNEKIGKVLFILHLPPPLHGASLSNSYLVNSKLIKDSFDMHVINFQFSNSIKDLKKFTFLKVFKSIGYALDIIRSVLIRKPDLVYFTLAPFGYAFYRDCFYVFLLKLFRLRVVFHLHGKGIKKSFGDSLFKKYIYAKVFNGCKVICLTHSLIKDIEDISSAIPYIVPYGIPLENITLKHNISINNNNIKILYLSNYVEAKGILILIDALSLLKEKGYVFTARLVGAPSDLSIADIVNYVSSNNLENFIDVVGPKFNEEKFFEFQNADIFVFPTFYVNETFGLVNLEAMQFGLPIITTCEGGISEIVIDNETGFIIEPKNVNKLAERLSLLIDNEGLRKEMGRKGKERFLENYTLERFEVNMTRTLQAIINSA